MAQLRAILFDIDDTLYSTTEFADLARSNGVTAMVRLGLRMEHEAVMRELREVIAEFTSNYEGHFDKLLLRLPREVYEGLNPAILVAGAVIAYHETKASRLRPLPDVVEALRKLSHTELILGVITMGPQVKQAEKILRLGLMDYIDPSAIFISDQIGISKPNPKLYLRACRSVGVPPEEAMYVGDNPPNDISPPKSIGMMAVLNRRSGKYSRVACDVEPDYRISDFTALRGILRDDFALPV